MNIAVFAKKTFFHSGSGGLETSNKILVEGLVKKGHKVVVFSPKHEIKIEETQENGVIYKFINCKYKMGRFLGFFGTTDPNNWINRSYEQFVKYQSASNDFKFDIVLGQSSSALGIIRRRKELDIPVVSVAHGTIIGEYKSYISELTFGDFINPKKLAKFVFNTGFTLKNFFRRQRDFVHGSTKIIAVSNYVKTKLIEEVFVEESKVVVVPNGISPTVESFQQLLEEKNTNSSLLRLVVLGRVEKSKGVHLLLHSIEGLQNVELKVIGEGPYLPECLKLKEKLGLKNVHFVGKIPHEDVNKYLCQSDVFVLPTVRVEGFPMVLVEAMFAGLPIIASDVGGNSDAIDSGQNGFLVSPGRVSELRKKIEFFLDNKDKVVEMGSAGFSKALSNYTQEIMVQKYLSVFESVTK